MNLDEFESIQIVFEGLNISRQSIKNTVLNKSDEWRNFEAQIFTFQSMQLFYKILFLSMNH